MRFYNEFYDRWDDREIEQNSIDRLVEESLPNEEQKTYGMNKEYG